MSEEAKRGRTDPTLSTDGRSDVSFQIPLVPACFSVFFLFFITDATVGR